ncbi:MAG: hypothetical protein R3E10_06720 [Gemmatimonadota bacterium]
MGLLDSEGIPPCRSPAHGRGPGRGRHQPAARGQRSLRPLGACAAVLALATALAAPVVAQATDDAFLSWSGYLRSLTALQDLGYDAPSAERRSAFNGEVARVRWQIRLGERARLFVHDRVQVQLSSAPQGLGTGVTGFGVSAVPGRSLDLETVFVEEERFRAWHDLDRLALNLRTDAVDLTIGRQAITWGISTLFPVADLWAQFSPFELDTEEKRGTDAIRALLYPSPGLELDLVIADRGSARDLSGGVRATLELTRADLYLAAGKFWREAIAMAGAAVVLDRWKLRAEMAAPWDLDGGEARALRGTLGADRLGSTWSASIEVHRNGLGHTDAADYLAALQSPELARGETYLLGRDYLGAAFSYQATDRLGLALSALTNLDDPSLSLTPLASYDLGQNARIQAGALLTTGETPRLDPSAPLLRSEFGAYGRLFYTGLALYF